MRTGTGRGSWRGGRALLVCALALACRDSTGPVRAPRTFRMGFSAIPPRPDQAVTLQALNLWTSGHADAAILHVSVPYLALLSGLSASQEIRGNELGLANYYRAKGLRLGWVGVGLPRRLHFQPGGAGSVPRISGASARFCPGDRCIPADLR